MNSLSTQQLVSEARTSKGIAAFGELARRHVALGLYAARRYGVPSRDAEDVCQEALLIAHERLAQLDEPGAFTSWFGSIVRTCADRYTRRRRPVLPGDERLQVGAPPNATDVSEDHEALWSALEALSDRDRLVVCSHYISGYRVSEIARFMGLSEGLVKKTLHTARHDLAKELTMTNTTHTDDTARLGARVEFFLHLRHSDAEAVEEMLSRHEWLANALDVPDEQPHRWYLPMFGSASALSWAIERRDAEIVQTLLKHGADSNTRTRFGLAPLHQAVLVGDASILNALLDAGADLEARTDTGMSALELALFQKNAAIVEALEAAGALPASSEREAAASRSDSVRQRGGLNPRGTGIKAIDLFAPITWQGINLLSAPPGVGCLVLIEEILWRAQARFAVVGSEVKVRHDEDLERLFERDGILGPTITRMLAPGEHAAQRHREIEEATRGVDVLVLDADILEGIDLARLRDALEPDVTLLILEVLPDATSAPSPALEAVADTWIRFDARLAKLQIWPSIDIERSSASGITEEDPDREYIGHARAMIRAYKQRQALGERDVEDARAERFAFYLSQPFFVAQTITAIPGVLVSEETARRDVRAILRGEHDAADIDSMYMQGALEERGPRHTWPLFGNR